MSTINKVCVIGAGVMGAGIAAQAANAGAKVVLLDVAEGAADSAVQKLLKSKPAPFMHKSFAKRITTGTTTNDLNLVGDCDWVIEAIVEKLDIKQQLYAALAQHMRADAVLSSNTSTLPLNNLTQGMPDGMKSRFLITHFFNPPRYMRLLEIITAQGTSPDAVEMVRAFIDEGMGKSIVECHDTPGFIANRIGTYWLHCAVTEAFKQGIGIEEADAVLSRPLGVPKTGVFGLLDLVGIDLMPHILDGLEATLPEGDAFHALGPAPDLLTKMIKGGYTGRKGKGGFYRLNDKRQKEAIDLITGDYSIAKRPKPAAAAAAKKGGPRALFNFNSTEGHYAWSVMSKTLAYAASLVPEIADDIEAVDRAMRLGYNWKWGPFELIDKLGTHWLAQGLEQAGISVPELLHTAQGRTFYTTRDKVLHMLTMAGEYIPVIRPKGVLLLEDIKRQGAPLFTNRSARIWDVGDRVACLEFTSKMNSFNPFIMSMINTAVKELPKHGFKGLVLHNDGPHFSVGVNIAIFLVTANLRLWPVIRWILRNGQDTFGRMQRAPFPVVGAPSGIAVGGGCEVLLHCDRLVAHAESYIGLVEAGVGIVPGWGGCKELLVRWTVSNKRPGGPMVPVMKAFETIATAQVSTSAFEAKDYQFLCPNDQVVMNRDRLLATAKQTVLDMTDGYAPRKPVEMNLPGPSGRAALELAVRDFINKGVATPHDATIARQLARVLSGGDTDVMDTVSEGQILELEREAIIELAKTPESRARVAHMLKTGKPLRN